MSWRVALTDLETQLSRNTSALRTALEEYEGAGARKRQEFAVLRAIDAELVRNAFSAQDLFVTIVEGVLRLTTATLCQILLPDNEGNLVIEWSSDKMLIGLKVPISNSVTGIAFTTGDPMPVANVKECRTYHELKPEIASELAVPLKDEFGSILGVINVESSDVSHFSEDHMDLVTTVAAQAAVGLRNAQFYEEFVSILEIFNVVRSESESLEQILSVVGKKAREMVRAEACQVLTVFDDALIVAYTTGSEKPGVTRVKLSDSVSGLACERQQIIRYDDIETDPEAKTYYKDVLGGMHSELAVPIIWKDEVLGVINLESPRVSAFDEHHQKLIELFANQAAVAISSARRVQELAWATQSQSELWSMAQVGDAYGPLIHRLNSDAGAISAILSEIRYKYAPLLKRESLLDELLQNIEKKAGQVLEIPDRLRRQLNRILSYEEIDVQNLVERVLSRVNAPSQVYIERDFAEVPHVWAMPQLEDVVENLVDNAVEAMSSGGTIVVGTREWVTPLRSGGESITNGIEIYVADTCGGLPREKLATLWRIGDTDPPSAKRRHLGFGLWWVKAFVERIGGTVSVEPQLELKGSLGCRFTIRVPLKARRPIGAGEDGSD